MSGILHRARQELLALAPYSPARWDPSLIRLHANENPWRDPSDHSRGGCNRYPAPQPTSLFEAFAKLYGVTPEQVLVGRGSDEGIDLLVRAFCPAGRSEVLVCPPTFAMYRFAAEVQGARTVTVPLRAAQGFALDAGAVIAACTDETRIVFLCTPNNPTGNLLDPRAIEQVLTGLAGRALVVVDEAYVEFAAAPSLVPWLGRFDNLAILRTLSKAHGLAGARCGTVLASADVIALLRRLIPPYALTVPALEAVEDALHPRRLARMREQVAELVAERERLRRGLAALPGIRQVWPSEANFLLVASHAAGNLLQAGIDAGLLVRDVRGYPGLEDCLRITVGTAQQNDRLLAALEAA